MSDIVIKLIIFLGVTTLSLYIIRRIKDNSPLRTIFYLFLNITVLLIILLFGVISGEIIFYCGMGMYLFLSIHFCIVEFFIYLLFIGFFYPNENNRFKIALQSLRELLFCKEFYILFVIYIIIILFTIQNCL